MSAVSNVSLSIGGRSFTVACAAGEEAHVADLGKMIDAKLATMGGVAGQSEPRMLLFAALLLADELHEARSAATAPAPEKPWSSGMASRIASIAGRVENLAERLEALAMSD